MSVYERISMTVQQRDTRPDADQWGTDGTHWDVTLHYGDMSITIIYSMGSAHRGAPEKTDVVYCLLQDWWIFQSCRDFEEFCGDMGFDTDSLKALKTWHLLQSQSSAFEAMFMPWELEELEKLYENY